MADFKRATITGGRPSKSNSVLGRLRDVQIISSELALPISILERVVDYLPVGDLIRFARTSKRMRGIVYDDTRWVKKLHAMGCWNEAEARSSLDSKNLDPEDMTAAEAANAHKKTASVKKPSVQVTAAEVPGHAGSVKTNTQLLAETPGGSDFSTIPLAPKIPSGRRGSEALSEGSGQLNAFSGVRSIRGRAKQEYGKIYGVLRPFYKDALRIKNPSTAKIFRVYRDPKQQAQMLVQIKNFAKSDFSPGEADRNQKLDAIESAFEDAVAHEFEEGLKTGDVVSRMRKYANVLVVLNGGQRAVDMFLVKNALLQSTDALGDPSDCISPNNTDALFADEVHAFCSRLSAALNEQLSIMEQAFPSSVNVINPFISLLGKNVIASYVDRLLALCYERNMESYLRAISITYQQLFQCSRALNFPLTSEEENLEQFDEVVRGLFNPHFGTYLAEEIAFFKRKSDTEVTGWELQLSQQDSSIESLYMANVNRQADKRDFLTSFKKVVMMPVNALPSFQTSKAPTSKATNGSDTPNSSSLKDPGTSAAMGIPGRLRSPSRPATPLAEPPTTELAAKAAIMKARLEGIGSLFSLEVALSLVHLAKASIERLAAFTVIESEFSPGARSQCEAIFIELLKVLGERHVRAGFDKAVGHLEAYNPRASEDRAPGNAPGVAPLAMFLELVNVGDLIQQMIDVFFEQELVAARLTDKHDFLNPTLKEKKKFEQMLDERVAAGLNKGIEVLITEVDYQFATTQKTEDYNPDATGATGNQILDVGPSETARNIVDLVSSHTNMLVGSTDKSLLDVFNQEVGLRLYNSFCKHLKRQRVSVSGSIRLISDINHYYAFVLTFKNKDLQQYFNALRELSQIYLIGPEDAKEIATVIADNDRFRGIMRAEEVYEFTERRADWYQIRARVEKAMYGVGCLVM